MRAPAARGALLVLFPPSVPREMGGPVIAALLLANRKFTSRTMIAAVDWPLLLLFVCLFAITGALADTGIPWRIVSGLQEVGLLPDSLAILTPLSLVMSNTIGNVPWVVLLLQSWPSPPQGPLYALALLSSLSGNLLLIGSLANILVAERAATFCLHFAFAEYPPAPIPLTLRSMGIALL